MDLATKLTYGWHLNMTVKKHNDIIKGNKKQGQLQHAEKDKKTKKDHEKAGNPNVHVTRVSRPVCTVPGVLSAIASDICYLLKTSGFSLHSQQKTKSET